MAVVAGGLGLPEEGAIVAGGFGASDPAAPGFVNFTITVTSTATSAITAEVLDGETPPPPPTKGGAGRWGAWVMTPMKMPRLPMFVDADIYVHCQSSATIIGDVLTNFDAELETLLLVGAL